MKPWALSSACVCQLRVPTGRRPVSCSMAATVFSRWSRSSSGSFGTRCSLVIGNLVAAFCRRGNGARVELADATRREDRCLDAVAVEELDQPPNTNSAAEFALGQLQWRFIGEAT